MLLLVILVSQAAFIVLFRQDRAALLSRQFGDTKIAQLKALSAALANSDPGQKRTAIAQLERAYGARIVPETERRWVGAPAMGRIVLELEERLKDELGPDTELRVQPRLQLLWIKLVAGDEGYWAGFPMPRPQDELPARTLQWSAIILTVLVLTAYAFARYLARPLRELSAAVASVGEGKLPPPLAETGPSEIAALRRGFNRMLANLREIEDDRALLLAGVSHDLRTPLARLRLGVEMGGHDARERELMVADMEEMDKIISQFLDFARNEAVAPLEPARPRELLEALVERYRKGGADVRLDPSDPGTVPLRPVAFTRLAANLIDNAVLYGRAPVDVVCRREGEWLVLEVADRGPGIPVTEVERLKRPFTRGDPARSGEAGSGLGLAIVERIARMHRGRFDIVPREAGGALARVVLPLAAS